MGSRSVKLCLALALLGLVLIPVVVQMVTVSAQSRVEVITTTRAPETCACMMDLSTGSLNFVAKPAGSRENPVSTPLDWSVRLPDGTVERPWVVNPVPGAWHSGPPVGSRAMWINPYRPVNNQPGLAPENTNFTYSVVFVAPSAGRVYMRGGSDDPGWVYLNGVYTGINIPGFALWPSQPGWWVFPVSSGINNVTVVVRNGPALSPTGLLIEAFYCSDEAPPATVTATVTTTTRLPGTTETRSVTVTTTLPATTVTQWVNVTTTLPPTTVTTRVGQTTTETRTETVVSPVTTTYVSVTMKEVVTVETWFTTVKDLTTTTATTTRTVTERARNGDEGLLQDPQTLTLIIIVLAVALALLTAYTLAQAIRNRGSGPIRGNITLLK
ncbi:MAG: hypothetical protein NZ988_02485 [Thaumarchaeota archaeon]|nr:hypothetical protein [Candidatus Calditenuaceae archaeon]MDW8186903.1 hypothetical protein [Nitrososphaerota archaeon]